MDEPDKIAPFVTVLDGSDGTLLVQAPDLLQDGFQPDAMFVHRPHLNTRPREGGRHLAQQRTQTRLEGGLRHRVRVDMLWARRTQTRTQPPQIDSAQLPADRSS